jgi:hypothetical protein
MATYRVLDLDGSVAAQADLLTMLGAKKIAAQDWGPQLRLACTFGTFDRFRRWLSAALPPQDRSLIFTGSGDFHHVTLALLEQIREPFNLLVLDKHPDWMRGIPFLHCGTWLRHACRLPSLRRVFHCGGDLDFDNLYRWLAPWRELRSGRIVVFPARRRFRAGKWGALPIFPLQQDGELDRGALADAVRLFRDELSRYPLYVSIDKDVLRAEDAAVNWDSGLLSLADAITIIEMFLAAAGGMLAGADLLGDWSPIRLGHWLNRFCDWLDHPSPTYEPQTAAGRNQRANAALLQALETGVRS